MSDFVEIHGHLFQKPKPGVWYCPEYQEIYLVYLGNRYDGQFIIEDEIGLLLSLGCFNLVPVYLGEL